MNLIILTCLGILSFVHFGNSATAVLRDARDPEYPGKCVHTDDGVQIIMNRGRTITHRETCTRITCNEDFEMTFASCGVIGHPPECHLSEYDQTKEYPDCCPMLICPSM